MRHALPMVLALTLAACAEALEPSEALPASASKRATGLEVGELRAAFTALGAGKNSGGGRTAAIASPGSDLFAQADRISPDN